MDEGPPKEVSPELFSEQERKTMVRSFLDAYVRGAIKISFPEIGEVRLDGTKTTGEHIMQIRRSFDANFAILVGTVKSTETQFAEALANMFHFLIETRHQDRIQGDFLSVSDTDRLRLLEGRVDDIEGLLQELKMRLRVGGNKPP